MKMAKIRVVLADEFPIVLTGLRALLAPLADMEIVGETEHSHNLLELVERTEPDVLVVDARTVQVVGVARLRAAADHVLVFCRGEDAEAVAAVLPHDAVGFLTKDAAVESIAGAVRRVARGETGWLAAEAAAREAGVALTAREIAVLRLIVEGKTNHEIATVLGISDKTVEKHVGVLFGKLSVGSRVEVAVWAVQQGIV